jgi:hypothetical protein
MIREIVSVNMSASEDGKKKTLVVLVQMTTMRGVRAPGVRP